jgi:hypothetical protein
MHRRSLRLPFVVTVAATSAGACGGIAVVETDPSGAGGSTSAGPTSTSAGNGTGSSAISASSAASTSIVGTPTDCPATHPQSFQQCTSSSVCTYDVSCQSGIVSLSFVCGEYAWELLPGSCTVPYDSCPGTDFYCDTSWSMPVGSNPPSPCPEVPPPPGEACFWGGMGGVWEHCGYRCQLGNPDSEWTIATCGGPADQSSWSYDGVCNGKD